MWYIRISCEGAGSNFLYYNINTGLIWVMKDVFLASLNYIWFGHCSQRKPTSVIFIWSPMMPTIDQTQDFNLDFKNVEIYILVSTILKSLYECDNLSIVILFVIWLVFFEIEQQSSLVVCWINLLTSSLAVSDSKQTIHWYCWIVMTVSWWKFILWITIILYFLKYFNVYEAFPLISIWQNLKMDETWHTHLNICVMIYKIFYWRTEKCFRARSKKCNRSNRLVNNAYVTKILCLHHYRLETTKLLACFLKIY